MKLLISVASWRLIQDFAKSVDGRIECASLKITIIASHISIIFWQPERYSRLIGCAFRFSSEVDFFYEDIRVAFSERAAGQTGHMALGSDRPDEMVRNDEYVMEVIKFCKENWVEIIRVPPFWYGAAVEISDKKIRSEFPVFADEVLKAKIRLLDIWRAQSDG